MTRGEPREQALESLYESELGRRPPVTDGLGRRATAMVEGVVEHREALDRLLGEKAVGWSIDRMPPVDRTLLRIAVFELLFVPETPAPVIISEAVGLAKRYSTERSGPFVNGVLGAIAAEVRASED